jgi:hypothetical protein
MLKFRCDTSIGYESRKGTRVVQCGFWGGHKSTLVKHKYMLFPPACIFPLITEDLPGNWPGPVHENGQPAQSVPYQKLTPPRVFRTATKIPFMCSFSGNCAASVLFQHSCVCEQFIFSLRNFYIPRIGPHIFLHAE